MNQSGRVMFRRKFMLWDDSNSSVASFNTSFLVNIFPLDNSHGEGLAFLIAPTIDIPNNSHGPYLGLTNATTNNQATNGIVAVELDTVKQNFDNDSNHIGLNIHSIRSVVSKPLSPENITLVSSAFHNIWIQYNGVQKIIRVYIASQPNKTSPTPPMPNTPIIEHPLDLRKTVNQSSYIGFAASTGIQTQLNCVLRWNITVEYIPGPKSLLMAISLGVGIPVLVGLVALIAYYLYKMRLVNRSQSNILNRLRTLPGTPKEFRFQELKKATNNFDEKRKLGQGGYGVVYRGVLPEDNVEVAVKWFLRDSLKGEGDFLAELTIINRLRHKHLGLRAYHQRKNPKEEGEAEVIKDSEWVREVIGLSQNVGLEALAESLNIPEGSQDNDSLKVQTELPRSQSMKVLALLVGSLVIVIMKNEGALLHFHDIGKDHGMRKRKKRCKWRRQSCGDSWSRQRAPLEQKAASYKHYSKSSELRNKSEARRHSLFNFQLLLGL
ncbi:hypothetical protein L1987_05670 [Smallanthus sonchifolius]|uniref:Uncharacterized protein n=1 Tax=Smallanthus sonchifolius TaxID=185202 RepID=A0ACB9JW05_9ASTR|nr:hypothetical protein L1987_05670 [Smallanthus sonchifolius]